MGAVEVFAVEIGAGRAVVLLAVACSSFFAAATDLVLPLVCPFDAPLHVFAPLLAVATGFLSSGFPKLRASFPLSPSWLSTSIGGVSTALSGIVSSITALFCLALISAASESFLSAVASGCSSSSILKLSLRFAILGSPLVSLLSLRPICPLFSTATKLVRTLERGRGDAPVL